MERADEAGKRSSIVTVPMADRDRLIVNVYDPRTKRFVPHLLPADIDRETLVDVAELADIEPPEETP